jgi:hypothetical protein
MIRQQRQGAPAALGITIGHTLDHRHLGSQLQPSPFLKSFHSDGDGFRFQADARLLLIIINPIPA